MAQRKGKIFMDRLLAAAVCLQLFWVLFDLACPQSLFLPELSSLLLAAALTAKAVSALLAGPKLPKLGATSWWLALSVSAYLLIDALCFLRSGGALFWEKYRVVGVSLLTAAGLAACLMKGLLHPKQIFSVIWFSGIAVGIVALADSFLLNFTLNPYTYRITTRIDYNMYATVLFCAGCGGFGVWLKSRRRMADQLLFLLSAAFLWVMAYLSGSRRILLALLPVSLVFVVFLIRDNAKKPQLLASAAVGVILLSLFSAAAAAAWENRSVTVQENAPPSETSLSQRYETVTSPAADNESGALKTRTALWRAALREIYTAYLPHTAAFWFGKGGGWDIRLYDRLLAEGADSELSAVFADGEKYAGKLSAHNFLLTDMLCGGMVKLLSGVVLWGVISAAAVKAFKKDYRSALPVILITAAVLANNLISNRYGFLYDKYLYVSIILIVDILERGTADERQNGYLYNDLGAPEG